LFTKSQQMWSILYNQVGGLPICLHLLVGTQDIKNEIPFWSCPGFFLPWPYTNNSMWNISSLVMVNEMSDLPSERYHKNSFIRETENFIQQSKGQTELFNETTISRLKPKQQKKKKR